VVSEGPRTSSTYKSSPQENPHSGDVRSNGGAMRMSDSAALLYQAHEGPGSLGSREDVFWRGSALGNREDTDIKGARLQGRGSVEGGCYFVGEKEREKASNIRYCKPSSIEQGLARSHILLCVAHHRSARCTLVWRHRPIISGTECIRSSLT
jgi:hypothetical protein